MQEQLLERFWHKHTTSTMRSDQMKLMCMVRDNVYIKDLGRNFKYNECKDISPVEVNRSKDLQNAITNGWIKVLDKNQSQPPKQQYQPPKVSLEIDQKQLIELATRMAKEMAQEMIQEFTRGTSGVVNQLKQEVTKMQNRLQIDNKTTDVVVVGDQAVDVEYDQFVKIKSNEPDEVQSDLSNQIEMTTIDDESIKNTARNVKILRKRANGNGKKAG